LLVLVEIPKRKVQRARAYLVMIRFDKDVLHVWGRLPSGPTNHPTILLQAEFSEDVPGIGNNRLRL